jgi:hypothetical protein
MTRLGYQIPNFTYPGTSEAGIFDSVVAQAKAAEAAGVGEVRDLVAETGHGWFL